MRPLLLAGFAALAAAACAGPDFTLGYSKTSGMAGAGLALRYEGTGAYPTNPAGLAYMQKFRLTNLDVGYVLDGVNFREANDLIKNSSKGGISPDDLSQIAKDFGGHDASFGLNARIGAGSSGINVGFEGKALARTTPNAQLKQWADAGADVNNPVPGMRLDGHGYGYTSFNVGYGRPVTTKDGTAMAVGAQMRFLRSYYTHHFVDQNQILNGGSTAASEMGGDDVLSKTGVGVDLGWHMESKGDKRVEYAVVLTNLIKPNVGFEGTEPGSLTPTTIDPFERSINFGIGFTGEKGQVAALDVINVGTHYADVRMGVDVPLSQQFGARAGYSGRGGFTAGVTLFNVSLTFGTTNTFQAGTFFRF
ncbi:MAG: hypothetical protein JST30_01665 [Armatimonadetes bacterium]|nr:hypothetical protein [Armatimonadota bacterium]